MPAVESSAIRAIRYHEGRRVLTVTFTSGRRYAYAGVAPEVYRAFLAAESKGQFFNAQVRDAYATVEAGRDRRR